jgi:hypothetical protein
MSATASGIYHIGREAHADDSSMFVEKAMQNKLKEVEQLIKTGADVKSKTNKK